MTAHDAAERALLPEALEKASVLARSDETLTAQQRAAFAGICLRASQELARHGPGHCMTEAERHDLGRRVGALIVRVLPESPARSNLMRELFQLFREAEREI